MGHRPHITIIWPKTVRTKSIARKRGGWNHKMRSANMSESAGTPEAKSAPVSVLPNLVVLFYRHRSHRVRTHIPHKAEYRGWKAKYWALETLAGWEGNESRWPLAPKADWAKPLKNSYIFCSFWNSHLQLAAKTCRVILYRMQRAFLLCPSFVCPSAQRKHLCWQPHAFDVSRLWVQDPHHVHRLPLRLSCEQFEWVFLFWGHPSCNGPYSAGGVRIPRNAIFQSGFPNEAVQELSLGFVCAGEKL